MTLSGEAIDDAFEGERMLALDPPADPSRAADTLGWRRRPNLFPGRALTDQMLTQSQRARDARITRRGEVVEAGVVEGLDATFSAGASDVVTVRPGEAVLANGAEVTLLRALRVSVDALRVWRAGAQPLRRISRTAQVGILALEAVETQWDPPRRSPDEAWIPEDAEADAETDPIRSDGVRLVFVPFDEPGPEGAAVAVWRNAMALERFEEDFLEEPATEGLLPLALVALDSNLKVLAFDTAAVRRIGGGPTVNPVVLYGTSGLVWPAGRRGRPDLWRARIDQFGEQLMEALALPSRPDAMLEALFVRVPPVAFLPRGWLRAAWREPESVVMPVEGLVAERPIAERLTADRVNATRAWATRLLEAADAVREVGGALPAHWSVEIAPHPVEELEDVFAESASLAPFSTSRAEHVRLLLAVPLEHYDPALLACETVPDVFERTRDERLAAVNVAVTRREHLRRVVTTIRNELLRPTTTAPPTENLTGVNALNGLDPPFFPATDYAAVEGEQIGTLPAPGEEFYGVNDVAAAPQSAALETFDFGTTKFTDAAIFDQLTIPKVATLPQLTPLTVVQHRGLRALRAALDTAITRAADTITLGHTRLQADALNTYELIGAKTITTTLATSPILAPLIKQDLKKVTTTKIQTSLERLEKEVAGTAPQEAPSVVNRAVGVAVLHTPILGAAPAAAARVATSETASLVEVLGLAGRNDLPIAVTARPTSTGVPSIVRPSVIARPQPVAVAPSVIPDRPTTIPAAKTIESTAAWTTFSRANTAAKVMGDAIAGLQSLGIDTSDVTRPPVSTTQPDKLADLLKSALSQQEGMLNALWQAEARVERLRALRDRVDALIAEREQALEQALSRLAAVERELAEARHDVIVARALLAEEQARCESVNAQRLETLRAHVAFLVLQRPRTLDLRSGSDAAVIPLEPAPAGPAVPVKLPPIEQAPHELQEYIDLMRGAPARWFVNLKVAKVIDTRPKAMWAIEAMGKQTWAKEPRAPVNQRPAEQKIAQTNKKRYQKAEAYRRTRTEEVVDASRYSVGQAATWVQQRATVGDLLSGHPSIAALSQAARAELERIGGLATALYEALCDVKPALRLRWMLTLGQYDEAVDLRSLTALEGWNNVGREDGTGDHTGAGDRRRLQSLVDGLFARVDARDVEALDLINDLVQVCILLSAHAPVREILHGVVRAPTRVALGGVFEVLVADPRRVRRGAEVVVDAQDNRKVFGVVDDVDDKVAWVRVSRASGGASEVELLSNLAVRFMPFR